MSLSRWVVVDLERPGGVHVYLSIVTLLVCFRDYRLEVEFPLNGFHRRCVW